jgi:hypothetical protein
MSYNELFTICNNIVEDVKISLDKPDVTENFINSHEDDDDNTRSLFIYLFIY